MSSQPDPNVAIADSMAKTQTMITEFWEQQMKSMPGAAEWLAPWRQWNAAMTVGDPGAMLALAQDYWSDSLKLWSSLLGGDAGALPAAAAKKDKRFASEAWDTPAFDALRRAYLLTAHYMTEAAGKAALPDTEKARLKFQVKQFVDAMSPANFAATNPEVIAAAQASGGQSLVTGLEHLLHDLKRGQMSLTDESAFEVGRNVAVTPGKVVFENRLFQLLQYTPTTDEVFAEPLLIFPRGSTSSTSSTSPPRRASYAGPWRRASPCSW
jgi:polyhydroxyalkanoate synthase